ncbi:MAG: HlyD family efflux transporter periplasmic adaptor subunit [Chloroflexi bacterium]|nr:HlyD family efflux transporter periplasmic adaptor subunit [Chloroflexota bacterium]
MNSLLISLKGLRRRQIIALAAVLVAAFGSTFGVFVVASESNQQSLEENQRLVVVRFGNLVNEVSVNGNIVFSNKETLSFGSSGTIAEVLVSDGQEVAKGQPLVRLDAETTSTLRVAVAQAKIDVQNAESALEAAGKTSLAEAEAGLDLAEAMAAFLNAQDELDQLRDPDSQDLAEADAAVSDARIALLEAQDDLSNPLAVAEAEEAVVQARIDLEDAQEALGQDLLDAIADVNAATKDLEAARQDLSIAPRADAIRTAQDNFETARENYLDVLDKWAGAEIAEGDPILSPPEFFEAWDFEPAIIYDRNFTLFPGGTIGDLPETKWNELTVYGWVWLYPDATSIEITCVDDDRSSSGNTISRRDANQELCIQRDFDDTWKVFSDARDDLESVLAQDTQDAAQAEADIIRAEATLADAQKTLDSLSEGLQAELLEKSLVVALAGLARADSDLEKLVSPDSDVVEGQRNQVALAQAAWDAASRDLEKLRDPDGIEMEVRATILALADAALSNAQSDLTAAVANRENEIVLRESELALARANLDAVAKRFGDSTLTAPFDGFVSGVRVEEGDEVGATTVVVEVIDPTIVRVDGIVDEIDVLSVNMGSGASVTLDALPNARLTGRVTSVSSAATADQGVVTFDIEIEVVVPEGLRLQEGLSAVANLALGEEQGLLVPSQAIHGTFNEPLVLVKSGALFREQPVTLGTSDGFWTVVYEGLSEGEEVVIEVQESTVQQLTGFRGFRARSGGGGGGGFQEHN